MSGHRSDEQGGVERRGLLKGLGLGALGLTGTSALVGEAVAQDGMISFIELTPPGEDVEDDSTQKFTDSREGTATGDLVFGLNLGVEQSVPLGYQITIVDRVGEHEVVPGTFEEGNSRTFSGTVKSDSAGFAQRRERISLSGLGPDGPGSPNHYWAVLTVVDYSGLSSDEQENQCRMDCDKVKFDVHPPKVDAEVSAGKND